MAKQLRRSEGLIVEEAVVLEQKAGADSTESSRLCGGEGRRVRVGRESGVNMTYRVAGEPARCRQHRLLLTCKGKVVRLYCSVQERGNEAQTDRSGP